MRYVTIPKTHLTPSAICLGVADIGVKNTEREAYDLLDFFVANGGTFVDTARIYSDWVPGERGRSERILGDWLQVSGMRDRIILATKGAHPDLAAMGVPRLSPREVREDLEASLRALRVDRIDLYYLHRDDPQRPVETIVDMLDRFVEEGKIQYYACSNWKPTRIEAALRYAHAKGTTGFVANQMLWNVGSWSMRPLPDTTIAVFDQTTRELHRRFGLAAVPFSSQANGFFTKLQRQSGTGEKSLHSSAYYTETNLRLFRLLCDIAFRENITVTEVVLLYLLEQDIPTIPIVGCHTRQQLAESLAAADKHLTPAIRDQIEKTAQGGVV